MNNKTLIKVVLATLLSFIILALFGGSASAEDGSVPPRTVPPTTVPEPVRGDDCLPIDSEFYPGTTRWTATPCDPRTGELLGPDWNANDIPIVPAPYPEVAQSAPAPLVTPATDELPVTGIKTNIAIVATIIVALGGLLLSIKRVF